MKPGEPGKELVTTAAEHGVLLRFAGDTVVFAPPLVSTDADLEEMVDRFAAAYRTFLSSHGVTA